MANSPASAETQPRRRHRVNFWQVEEDRKLGQLVREHGPQNWKTIAGQLEGRTGKSCRLRWCNHLDPRLNKTPFTREEEERLLAARDEYGARWAHIANLFNGRTDNALKNHWHVMMARRRKNPNNWLNSATVPSEHRAHVFMYPNGSLSSVKFGIIPSFAETFPVMASLGREATRGSTFGLYNAAGDGGTLRGSVSSSSSVQVQAGEEEVPFYDFLGVGDQ